MAKDPLDEMIDDSFDAIPAFPSEAELNRARDLEALQRRVAGCKTKDGALIVCPGVLVWIYDGDHHALELQKLGAFGDLQKAKTVLSRDRQFEQASVTFDDPDVRHMVMTKRSNPSATATCQVRVERGEQLCRVLLSATAKHGRAEVGRAVAGNVGIVKQSLFVPRGCKRNDRPGHVDIRCPAVTLGFGRAKKSTSEIGMRVLLANSLDRFERTAQAEGALVSRSATERCTIDGKEGECVRINASMIDMTQTTVFGVGLYNKVYVRCAIKNVGLDAALPTLCSTLIGPRSK